MLKKIEDILAQCIEDIKAGRSNVEDCLNKYPSMRKRLEPLLRIALEIREPPDVKPSPAFKVRARVELIEQIHARQAVTKWPWFRYTNQVEPMPYKRRFNMVAIIVAIVLALCAAGGGTAYASQNSLPGDVLYPVKLGTEQVRMILPRDDVAKAELHLTFANRRVEEMTALAERGRPENVNLAVNGYEEAMAKAIEKLEEASGKGLAIANISELVAEDTLKHLEVLEWLKDEIVPPEAVPGINVAIEASQTGYQNALRALAGENPGRAMEINLAAMEGRLNRARTKAEENDVEEVENALLQFEELRQFGEEISEIAQGLGDTTTVDELVARATSIHLEILAEVYDKVPEQAKEAIEQAMEESVKGHQRAVEALEEAGVSGTIPEEPPIPEGIPDDVEEKLKELIPPKPPIPTGGRP